MRTDCLILVIKDMPNSLPEPAFSLAVFVEDLRIAAQAFA